MNNDSDSSNPTVDRATMALLQDLGGGMAALVYVSLPVDDVLGYEEAAKNLLPLYEAENCTFQWIEVTRTERTTEDPRNP